MLTCNRYFYYNSWWTKDDNKSMDNYKGEHTTDVIQKKALDMLDDAASTGDQFFMMVAPGKQGPPQSYNVPLLINNSGTTSRSATWCSTSACASEVVCLFTFLKPMRRH
jgi:hypothetical protein